MTDITKFEFELRKVIDAMYNLNNNFGQFLTDGLEDRMDQTMNLLQKMVDDMK